MLLYHSYKCYTAAHAAHSFLGRTHANKLHNRPTTKYSTNAHQQFHYHFYGHRELDILVHKHTHTRQVCRPLDDQRATHPVGECSHCCLPAACVASSRPHITVAPCVFDGNHNKRDAQDRAGNCLSYGGASFRFDNRTLRDRIFLVFVSILVWQCGRPIDRYTNIVHVRPTETESTLVYHWTEVVLCIFMGLCFSVFDAMCNAFKKHATVANINICAHLPVSLAPLNA